MTDFTPNWIALKRTFNATSTNSHIARKITNEWPQIDAAQDDALRAVIDAYERQREAAGWVSVQKEEGNMNEAIRNLIVAALESEYGVDEDTFMFMTELNRIMGGAFEDILQLVDATDGYFYLA